MSCKNRILLSLTVTSNIHFKFSYTSFITHLYYISLHSQAAVTVFWAIKTVPHTDILWRRLVHPFTAFTDEEHNIIHISHFIFLNPDFSMPLKNSMYSF